MSMVREEIRNPGLLTMCVIRGISLLILVFLATVRPGEAQLYRGFISGTVTDSSDARLPGAQVTITNIATNVPRDTVTNEVGFYRFAAVEPGQYAVEFKLQGFETKKVPSVLVRTAQEKVINATLAVSAVAVEVTVVETPGVELDKTIATIERTFNSQVVSELPMQIYNGGRDISRLALLAPTANRAPGSNEFAVNGQRARNNNFMIDGVDNNDLSVSLSSARVIPEAVQEVQVQTTSYSAEFGRNTGAQFSAVTKSGTNAFHGEAWEFYRGNWMEPVSLINKRTGVNSTPRFVVNQFGGDVGGPIVKDRTFFFGLLEGNRRREAPDARNITTVAPPNIPTPAGYAALSNVPLGPVQTAASRQAVLSALGFLSEVYPQVSNYENVRNITINGVPIQVGTVRIPFAKPANYWYNVGRIDHRLSDNDNLSYRYHLDKRDQPDQTGNQAFGTRWTASQTILRQNHAISYTRIFSPRLLNEARVSYVRGSLDFPERDPKSPTVGITGFFTMGGLLNFPQSRIEQLYQFQDVATYTLGRNSFKVGLDVRRNTLFNRSGFNSKGTWVFGSLEDFLNNKAATLTQAVNESTFTAKQWNQAYFFQDDLKASKDLTLNLGLRYEYSTVPLGFFGATDPAVWAVGVQRPARPDKSNWAPRFGLAYSPSAPQGRLASLLGNGKTSIRGGFGVAYDVLFYNILINTANNYPRVVNSEKTNLQDQFPVLASKDPTIPPFAMLGFANATEDIQNPTMHFWSLSMQREFATNYVLELGYTGNRSYHGIRQGQANPPLLTAQQAATVLAGGTIPTAQDRRLNPNWGSRTLIEATAKGEYHAGYVKFDKRMSRGLLVGANYTWSANFSDNDELNAEPSIILSSPNVPQDFFNYRNEWSRSVFDRPHRFVLHYLYEIPWFQSAPGLKAILGGWQVSGSTEFQSGQPFTIRTGIDTVGTTAGATNPPGRPNYNPSGIMIKDPVTGDLRTFTIPINGTGIVVAPLVPNSMPGGGNLGRNTFRGPSFQNWNFSLMKKISIKENWQVQLRTDFVNLWNHNNFQNPEARMSNTAFGANTATLLTDAREIMFGAKIHF